MAKRKKVKKPKKKEELMLAEAFGDIKKELENLRVQKNRLDTRLKNIGTDINVTQTEESRLREEISALVGKEGLLDRRKNKIKVRLDELKGKIAKVSKIKDELGEV